MENEKQICKNLKDQEIIAKSRSNIRYFSCIYDRYEMRLLLYIARISNLSDAEAQDILQDSFIKAWINLNDFDQNLAFSSWIYRIVHNETISAIRKKKSYGKSNTVELKEEFLLLTDEENESEKETGYKATLELVNQLSLKYKEVIILKFYEKMSYEEISDVLKIPEGTVAVRINRAKKQLKRTIEKSNHNS